MLGILLSGLLNGVRRPAGRTTRGASVLLRSGVFYSFATALFLAFSAIFWKPLPLILSSSIRWLVLIAGLLIYFSSQFFVLWARLTLGESYFVTTTFGAQLLKDHKLIMEEPSAIVCHPIYLVLIASTVDSLLPYQTWTTAAFAIFDPFLLVALFARWFYYMIKMRHSINQYTKLDLIAWRDYPAHHYIVDRHRQN